MFDRQAIEAAFVTRLRDDTTLMTTLVEGVTNGHTSPEATWARPWLRFNVQDARRDPGQGYGQRTYRALFLLMAFDRGSAPGVGSYHRCHAALQRAWATLLAGPLVVAGMTVWDWDEADGVPGAMPPDAQGFLRPQVGWQFLARVDQH